MQVLVWSIADHITTLTATGKMHNAVKGEKLQHRIKLEVQCSLCIHNKAVVQAPVWLSCSPAAVDVRILDPQCFPAAWLRRHVT